MKVRLAVLACVVVGCSSPPERPATVAPPCTGAPVDSVRAARLATDAFLREDSALPLRVLDVRRDGCTWLVTLVPDTVIRGGGGVVRVDSAGAMVVERHQ